MSYNKKQAKCINIFNIFISSSELDFSHINVLWLNIIFINIDNILIINI
jgi:hypothetical protein